MCVCCEKLPEFFTQDYLLFNDIHRVRFDKLFYYNHLKLVFQDFFATVRDVACVFGRDNFGGEDVALVVRSARVDLFAVCVRAHAQSTHGDAPLAQACRDPTVCTWNMLSLR